MRLIDADALKEELNSWAVDLTKSKSPHYIKDDADCIIDNAPTIEAVPMDDYMDLHNHFVDWEPVRHGRWVVAGKTTHYYICSVCGEPGDGFDNYCRSCGSRMKGWTEDEID